MKYDDEEREGTYIILYICTTDVCIHVHVISNTADVMQLHNRFTSVMLIHCTYIPTMYSIGRLQCCTQTELSGDCYGTIHSTRICTVKLCKSSLANRRVLLL